MVMIFYSRTNKTHFHKKGCALDVILKVRVFGTRKWPIKNNNGDGQTERKTLHDGQTAFQDHGSSGWELCFKARPHNIYTGWSWLSVLKFAWKLKVLLSADVFYQQCGEFLRSPFFFPQILRYGWHSSCSRSWALWNSVYPRDLP